MSEETSNAITNTSAAIAFCVAIFFISKCAIAVDASGEQRRMEAVKSEERVNAERVKAGQEYISQGSWINRQPVDPSP